MKRLFAAVLIVCMLCSIMPAYSLAEDVTPDEQAYLEPVLQEAEFDIEAAQQESIPEAVSEVEDILPTQEMLDDAASSEEPEAVQDIAEEELPAEKTPEEVLAEEFSSEVITEPEASAETVSVEPAEELNLEPIPAEDMEEKYIEEEIAFFSSESYVTVSDPIDGSITNNSVNFAFTMTVSEELAAAGYKLGLQLGLDPDFRTETMAWTGRPENEVKNNFEDTFGIPSHSGNLVPGVTYYYRPMLTYIDNSRAYINETDIHSFQTLNNKNGYFKLTENEPIPTTEGPQNGYFTAETDGLYIFKAAGGVDHIVLRDSQGHHLASMDKNRAGSDDYSVSATVAAGETVYLSGGFGVEGSSITVVNADSEGSVDALSLGSNPARYSQAYKFTSSADGWYKIYLDHPEYGDLFLLDPDNGSNEPCHAATMTAFLSDGDSLFFMTKFDQSQPMNIVVESVAVPLQDAVSSSVEPIEVTNHEMECGVTLSITPETAEMGYIYGVEVSPFSSFHDEYGNEHSYQWWRVSYDVCNADTFIFGGDELIPNSTYYYRGFIRDLDFNPLLIEDSVHSFTTANSDEGIISIALESTIPLVAYNRMLGWFSSASGGLFTIIAHDTDYVNVTNSEGRGIAGDDGKDEYNVSFELAPGEKVYIHSWSETGGDLTLYPAEKCAEMLSLGAVHAATSGEVVAFKALEAGYYSFSIDHSEYGELCLYDPATGSLDWDNPGAVTLQLEAGSTVYFLIRFDERQGGMNVIAEKVQLPADNQISCNVIPNRIGNYWADFTITYSATKVLAEQGYYVGVAFSSNPDVGEDYQRDNFMWDWDLIDTPAGNQTIRRRIDEFVPGVTYYYYAYLRDSSGTIIKRESPIKSFSTLSGIDGIETLEEGVPCYPTPHERSVFMFTAEKSGLYVATASGPNGFTLLASDGSRKGGDWNDTHEFSESFGAEKDDVLYFSVFNENPGATLTVNFSGEAAIENKVSASDPVNVFNRGMEYDLTVSVTSETAKAGYRYGILISPFDTWDDVNLRFVDDNGYECDWDWSEESYAPYNGEILRCGGDDLLPNTTYYYRGVILDFDGEIVAVEDTTHQFTTQNSSDGIITLSAGTKEPLERERTTTASFTSTTGGLYMLIVNNANYVTIFDEAGRPFAGDYNRNPLRVPFGLDPGEKCYFATWSNRGGDITVYSAEDCATELPVVKHDVTLPSASWNSSSFEMKNGDDVVAYTANAPGYYYFYLEYPEYGDLIHYNQKTHEFLYCDNGEIGFHLDIGETAYFLIRYDWNSGNEIITVDQTSFPDVDDDTKYYYYPVYWALGNGITTGMRDDPKDENGYLIFNPFNDCTREQFVTFLWRAMGSPAPAKYEFFSDVPQDKWYADSISWAYENGITTGLNDGTGRFGVGQACTREQCVTFLWRAFGKPSGTFTEFTDVKDPSRYYYQAVYWAAQNGITVGMNDGTGRFGVGVPCVRAMLVTFLYRALGQ